jgi:uncharacterized SAM-dependent methyltransferase
MKIIRNIDIAKEYGVSATSVTNWIEAAKNNKNNLKLLEWEGRMYVEDIANNRLILENLSLRGRNYKSREEKAVIEPKQELYNEFNKVQLSEIIISLENNLEIPHKFTYFKKGAEVWDAYVKRTYREDIINTVTNTAQMLNDSLEFILKNIENGWQVNLIDIGCGNSYPVRKLIDLLLSREILYKYITIDISQDILDFSQDNISKWFGSNVVQSSYKRDISIETIQDILIYESNLAEKKIINLVMFVGSTIENQTKWHQTLESLSSSLSRNDLFLLGQTLDNKAARQYFDLSFQTNKKQTVAQKNLYYQDWQNLVIPNLINIPLNSYEIIWEFNEIEKCRVMNMLLLRDITIKFKQDNFSKELNLYKGQKIVIWKHSHHTLIEIIKSLNHVNLKTLFTTTSKDEAQVLTISKLKD